MRYFLLSKKVVNQIVQTVLIFVLLAFFVIVIDIKLSKRCLTKLILPIRENEAV